jgi:integrase
MARRTRSPKLENRTNRLKLAVRKKAYGVLIAPRIHLCYRRNNGPGTWSVKANGWLKRFALADDHEDANAETVLNYWQALDKAKTLARAGEGSNEQLGSVADAVKTYEADLKARGGRKYNATQLDLHLTDTLKNKTVALLNEKDLRDWRNDLVKKGLKPDSVNRIARSLKSALNLAASNDKRITNAAEWKKGLEPLAWTDDDDETVRDNFILADEVVAALVRGCYEEALAYGDDFGALIDVLAETGTRESQAFRLKPRDLQDDDPAAPYLTMPTSRKGTNRKKKRKIELRPVPISPRLAKALRQQANGRAADAPLFDRIWNLATRFRPVVKRLGLDPTITPYALRHSSIVRQLLKGMPIRVVAANHDTSVAIIEKHYSRYILNHSDELTRATLPDLAALPSSADVVPLARLAS